MTAKMKVHFDPDMQNLTIYSNSPGVGRSIHLSKTESDTIAEAQNPRIIPRIDVILRTLHKLEAADPARSYVHDRLDPRTQARIITTHTPNSTVIERIRIDSRTGDRITTTTTHTTTRTVQKARDRKSTALERFWKYANKGAPHECWMWKGTLQPGGYGQISVSTGRSITAHRYSWEIHHPDQPLQAGQRIRHHCDMPGCVNPAHLYIKHKPYT
jgi:hypothetical protein